DGPSEGVGLRDDVSEGVVRETRSLAGAVCERRRVTAIVPGHREMRPHLVGNVQQVGLVVVLEVACLVVLIGRGYRHSGRVVYKCERLALRIDNGLEMTVRIVVEGRRLVERVSFRAFVSIRVVSE